MPRRIAIIEDDPAIRANYSEALRKHGFEVIAYAARKEALAVSRAGCQTWRWSTSPWVRRRRRLRAVPRPARPVGDLADHLSHRARQRFRRRRRVAPGRRRLPDQGREPAAPARAHRRAFRRADLAAEPRRWRSVWSAARSRSTSSASASPGAGSGAAHAYRVLDGARARQISRAREESRSAHARGEPGGRRRHHHLAHQAHSQKFLAIDPKFDAIDTAYGMGYRWRV